MAEQTNTFLTRIGSWFRRSQIGDEQPMNNEDGRPPVLSGPVGGGPNEPRSTFLRPWAKRDAAIDQLQNGVGALSDLMNSIRESLERQSHRQEELLQYLSHLPQALQQLPESNRVQGETLKAIHSQIEKQTTQQNRLGDILERISQADNKQARTLDAIQERVDSLTEHDQAISQNLNTLGEALHAVSENSQASAHVLGQLRDNATKRDGELEKVIRKQNTRFTTLLAVAIVLSVCALVAVSIFGWLGYQAILKAH